jgi:hypothetical protein
MPLSQDQPNRIKIKAIFKKPHKEIPDESELDIAPITQDTMFEPLLIMTPRGTYVFTLMIQMFLLLTVLKFGLYYLF